MPSLSCGPDFATCPDMACPALIPAVALVVGTCLGVWGPAGEPRVLGFVAPLAALSAAVAYRFRRPRLLMGTVVLVAVTISRSFGEVAARQAVDSSLARLYTSGALGPADGAQSASDLTTPAVLDGVLREDASPGPSGTTLNLAVTTVYRGSASWNVRGGVLVTVSGTLAADHTDAWRAGRRLQMPVRLRQAAVYRNRGVPDNRVALARRGIALVGTVKSGALVEVVAEGGAAAEWAASCRAWIRRQMARSVGSWSARSGAIVTAILIGDRAGLDDEIRQRLQRAGTYHVIAISGGNIAILAAVCLLLFHAVRMGVRMSSIATAGVLVAYGTLVGWEASVARATVMGVVYLLARAGDHRSHALNVLSVAAGMIVVATPLAVTDAGFALTCGATLGILVGVDVAAPALPSRPWARGPASLLLASIAAEAALLPVAASTFSRVTCAGLLLNFAAIPLMTVAQLCGMGAVLAGSVVPVAGRLLGLAAHLGAQGLVESARLVDLAPWLTVRVPPPAWCVSGAYYLGWATLWWWHHRRNVVRSWLTIGSGLCGLVLVAVSTGWILTAPVWFIESPGRLMVTWLDVGQADATLVRLPDGRALLVDAGGHRWLSTFDIGSRVVVPAVWAQGVRRLDVLALTHGDPDHVGGAAAVIRDLRPREIWEGIPVPRDPILQALTRQAAQARIRWRRLQAGDVVRLGGVGVYVWHPPRADWERQKVRNDDSLVLEVGFGGVSIVLAGDVGREVEQQLASRVRRAGLRILKVPHHGSASSSSPDFLAALRPALAVLTVGEGSFVSPDVLARYERLGVELFRTDEDGAVRLETDGRTATVCGTRGRCVTLASHQP